MILFLKKGVSIVNLHTMNLRTLIFATMACSVAAFGQPPASSGDGPYQIRYATNTSDWGFVYRHL